MIHLKKNTILKLCFQNGVNILAKKLFENETSALAYMIERSPCVLFFPMYFLVSTHINKTFKVFNFNYRCRNDTIAFSTVKSL